MKVLILNLPIPEYYQEFQHGFNNLFAGYISAIVKKENLKDIEIIKLPRNIAENFNNHKIIEYILSIKPDIAAFSSYLWNVERNIVISDVLKKNDIITITGGPEVQTDNDFLLGKKCFDILVSGEGENIFIDILKKILYEKKIETLKKQRFFQGNEPVDFNDFILEFSSLTDDYKTDGLAYIEMERGCPFKCSFCAYGKSRNNITEIDFEIFKTVFNNFISKGVKDFYLLAPTLNRSRKNFEKYLNYIIETKKRLNVELKLFAELRPENITENDVELMKNAGFSSIEFGIQTFNEKQLESLNRKKSNFNLETFSKKLLENDIKPIIDFIIGLPEDDYGSIKKSIDIVEKMDLLDYCNFYHLELLPSTTLKKEFVDNNNIFQKKTPYFVLKTQKMDFSDIKNVYMYLEDEKEFSYRDDFFQNDEKKIFIIKSKMDLQNLMKNDFYHSSSFIFLDNFLEKEILDFFNLFFSLNSEIFHQTYLYSEKEISFDFLEKLSKIFINYPNFYDNYREGINYFNDEILSKTIQILVKPEINRSYFEELLNNYQTDFIIFPEEQNKIEKKSKKLLKIFNDEEIYTYVFKETDSNLKFIRRFNKKITL
jgi:radical SAM superfamily enzyme YgiQ (UPF0313 family)